MYGRFALYSSAEKIATQFHAELHTRIEASYNIAPTLKIRVMILIGDERHIVAMRWGFIIIFILILINLLLWEGFGNNGPLKTLKSKAAASSLNPLMNSWAKFTRECLLLFLKIRSINGWIRLIMTPKPSSLLQALTKIMIT